MQIFKKLLKYYLLMIAIFFAGRLGLFIWQYSMTDLPKRSQMQY